MREAIPQDPAHAYVDLGLPSGTLWATCNVGAEKPEDYGDYFAWGETKPKDYYGFDNEGEYKYGVYDDNDSPNYGMTKYNKTDNKTILDTEDDVATQNWGDEWKMPTNDQLYELFNSCTCKWTTLNGINGYKLTSKTNSNSIFLPAAGVRWGSSLYGTGNYGYYWFALVSEDDCSNAQCLGFDQGNHGWDNYYSRGFGFSVRPVRAGLKE